jgi:hypothetical protein
MRTLERLDKESLMNFRWENLTRQVMFKTFYIYPDRDFMVTPANLLANGVIDETYPIDAAFDCPLLPTAYKRNLFRLYATVVRVAGGVQLGIPEDHLSKLRAVEIGHPHLLKMYFAKNKEVSAALLDVYSVMFREDIVGPVGADSDAMDII